MTAGEAVVFWLSGFSERPGLPDLGRRRAVVRDSQPRRFTDNAKLDPIENRKLALRHSRWNRLGPRDEQRLFRRRRGSRDATSSTRSRSTASPHLRRINFWQFTRRRQVDAALSCTSTRRVTRPPSSQGGNVDQVPSTRRPPRSSYRAGSGTQWGCTSTPSRRINPLYNDRQRPAPSRRSCSSIPTSSRCSTAASTTAGVPTSRSN